MAKIIVAGIGTDVGKTMVSAILVKALKAEYWKPVQCGNLEACDTSTVRNLVNDPSLICHREAYRLEHAVSPHHAASLEGIEIDPFRINPPAALDSLIIESAGGLLVPLTDNYLQLDVMLSWQCSWILVSKHYVGSINHTLLALEALRSRGVRLCGIVFNGPELISTERVILKHAKVDFFARLNIEPELNSTIINQYAEKWIKNYGKYFGK